ncbi:MAG: glycosyltransferase [Lachnospiraceae bacterium]|nr:glycosyltransferase [Lachnospiraceae bacterium]
MSKWLSLIIPVYNVSKYLEECLESVVKNVSSCEGKVEAIIIDDGSTDGSGVIADKYALKYDYFRVIHKNNEGTAEARNTGIQEAVGEWLYFVDSDDWLAENSLANIYRRCRENRDAEIIIFDAMKNYANREVVWEHFSTDKVWHNYSEINSLQRKAMYCIGTPMAAPWDKVYRKEILDKNHICFQKELQVLDDMVFNVEAFGIARKVVYCKDIIYHYRYVINSITNSYKPNRVEQDVRVFEYLQNYMSDAFIKDTGKKCERKLFLETYYCRVIKSFTICCRLCFFNQKNEKNVRIKIKDLKAVLRQSPYREAFAHVKLRNLEWKLKIIVILGRANIGLGIYLMHCLNMIQYNWGKRRGKSV